MTAKPYFRRASCNLPEGMTVRSIRRIEIAILLPRIDPAQRADLRAVLVPTVWRQSLRHSTPAKWLDDLFVQHRQTGLLGHSCGSVLDFYCVVANSLWRLAVESSPAHTSNSDGSTTQALDCGFQKCS